MPNLTIEREKPQSFYYETEGYYGLDELPTELLLEAVKKFGVVAYETKIGDISRLPNFYIESETGHCLGFDSANTGKHGIDCINTSLPLTLEVKNYLQSRSRLVSFNNVNDDKIDFYKNENNFLGVSVFKDVTDLSFIVFGQTKNLVKFMEEKIKASRRSFNINIVSLITEYGFYILPISMNLQEVKRIVRGFNKKVFKNFDLDSRLLNKENFSLLSIYPHLEKEIEKGVISQIMASMIGGIYNPFDDEIDIEEFLDIRKNRKIEKNSREAMECFKRFQDTAYKITKERFDLEKMVRLARNIMTGTPLGFDMIGTKVYQINMRKKDNSFWLQSKCSWLNSDKMYLRNRLTFCDISHDRANLFKDKKVCLAVSVWDDLGNILYIIFGQSNSFGELFDEQFEKCPEKNAVGISIDANVLITRYHFKVLPVSQSKDDTIKLLKKNNLISFKDTNLDTAVVEKDGFKLSDYME